VSEQNAKVSEQNAKVSEQNAKVSEQNAKVSCHTPQHLSSQLPTVENGTKEGCPFFLLAFSLTKTMASVARHTILTVERRMSSCREGEK